MATRTWVGSVSAVWTTTGNWLEGSIPAADDAIVFGSVATRAPDPIDQSSVSPESLTILDGYRYPFGTSGSPIILGTIGVANLASGSSLIHLNATVTLAYVKLLQGQVLLAKGTWTTTLAIGSGLLDVDTATFTNTHARGLRVKMAAGTAPTLFVADSCSLESARNLTTVYNSGGNILTTGTSTIATIFNGGRLNHRSSGTITTGYNLRSGLIDPTGGSGFTVTTLFSDPDSLLNDKVLGAPVVVTNPRPLPSMGSGNVFLQGLNTEGFLT